MPLFRVLGISLSALLLLAVPPASAQWRTVASFGEDGYISDRATAFAVGSSGYHSLGLSCRAVSGALLPVLFTNGYPASGGASDETIAIAVDAADFTLRVRHHRADGLWIGLAPADLVSALQSGSSATVTVPGEAAIRYDLAGSATPIARALQACSG